MREWVLKTRWVTALEFGAEWEALDRKQEQTKQLSEVTVSHLQDNRKLN